MVPKTKYARSGDAHIAYQVFGSGSVDLVVFGALASHVELIWEDHSADEILVSQSIPPLVVGSGLEFASAGRRSLKGVPDEWELFYAKA